MISGGREETFAKWVSQLPAAEIEKDPWLQYWRAVATASFNEFEARRVFEDVYQLFRVRQDRLGMVISAAAVLSALEAGWQNFDGIEHWSQTLCADWTDDLAFPEVELELRAIVGLLGAADYCDIAHIATERYLSKISVLITSIQDANLQFEVAGVYLAYLLRKRSVAVGVEFAASMEKTFEPKTAHPVRLTWWHWNAARMYAIAASASNSSEYFAIAAAHRSRAMSIAQAHELHSRLIAIVHVEASEALDRGDLAAAMKAMEVAEKLLAPSMHWQLAWHFNRRARIALLMSEPSVALAHCEKAIAFGKLAHATPRMLSTYHHMSGICHIRLGDHEHAAEALSHAVSSIGGDQGRYYQLTSLFNDALGEAANAGLSKKGAISEFVARLGAKERFDLGGHLQAQLAEFFRNLFALDMHVEAATKIIRERKISPPANADGKWPWPVKIEALGRFVVSRWNEVLSFDGKAQKRPLEMLKFLVARSDPLSPERGVRIEELIESLWPSAETKDPKGSFDITVHRLRKLLDSEEALIISEGRLRLNPQVVWCDTQKFELLALSAINEGQSADEALSLYAGPLFGNGNETLWAFTAAERLGVRFTALVERKGAELEAAGDWLGAIALYERGIAQDGLLEEFYRGEMRAYLALGNPEQALKVYRRCRDLFSIVLGLKPAVETEELRKHAL
jgi:DNA-binding SARP family transcriptional activator